MSLNALRTPRFQNIFTMNKKPYPYSRVNLLIVVLCAAVLHAGYASTNSAGQVGASRQLYVSPDGNDQNPGDKGSPLASFNGALETISTILTNEGLPAGGVTVNFADGVYSLARGVRIGSRHSGSAEAPIVFQAQAGHNPRFSGGVTLDASAFRPVTDPDVLERIPAEARGKVRVLDLAEHNLELGQHPFRGHSLFSKPWLPRGSEPPELIFNGEPMTIARWPNEGFTQFARIVEEGSRPRDGAKPGDGDFRLPVVGFDDERPIRWLTATDAWLHGYWGKEWSDQTIQIKSISPETRTIELAQASTYGVTQVHRYFIFNLLEELDQPGEWYLDRSNKKLYFYPPSDLQTAEIVLSQLSGPLLSITDTSHLLFKNLTFEAGRGRAISISRGSNITIHGCVVRNFAGEAIQVIDGTDNTVFGCHIHAIGGTAIRVGGGDDINLIAANNNVENNHIHNFSRITRTYTPGIAVTGVGQRIAHNEIHDAPHMGMGYSGNNHILEYNVIYDIAKETADVGGIYGGRNWASRGNIIRYNLFHSIKGLDGGYDAAPIYFDDAISSALVQGNIIHGARARAVKIGGGHHVEVVNNLFVECRTPVGLDDRLLGWGARMIPGLMRSLEAVLDRPAWLEAYPELKDILTREPGPTVPHNNVIERNLIYRSGDIWVANSVRQYNIVKNNLQTDEDPGFADPKNFNFAFPEDSWIYSRIPGFEPIPFDKIGRYDVSQ
jgi:hypothetical protein